MIPGTEVPNPANHALNELSDHHEAMEVLSILLTPEGKSVSFPGY
jgi:hypothetical protein